MNLLALCIELMFRANLETLKRSSMPGMYDEFMWGVIEVYKEQKSRGISSRKSYNKYNLISSFRNSMSPICSYAWATPRVQVSGHWRSLRIMARLGHHGSISPIHPPIVRLTLARIRTNQLQRITMSFAPRNIRKLCR